MLVEVISGAAGTAGTDTGDGESSWILSCPLHSTPLDPYSYSLLSAPRSIQLLTAFCPPIHTITHCFLPPVPYNYSLLSAALCRSLRLCPVLTADGRLYPLGTDGHTYKLCVYFRWTLPGILALYELLKAHTNDLREVMGDVQVMCVVCSV
jgi:hypothetical protein